MKNRLLMLLSVLAIAGQTGAQTPYNGLGTTLDSLSRLSEAKTRSISPENPTGEPGKGAMSTDGVLANRARELGQGWKINPYVVIKPGETYTMADMTHSGAIQHIWMTPTGDWRKTILRMYWDDEKDPSVEVPVGDFFAMGWNHFAPITSLPISVNPGSAFNSYWQMPFRKRARITLENLDLKPMTIFYQIDYTETTIPADVGYFHAQFRRVNPLPFKEVYTILDGVKGQGQYVGTYLAFGANHTGWWGEGEIKFYLDDDTSFPTIAGTGTEDYFTGSYNFENKEAHQYQTFTGPYAGLAQVIRPDGLYQSQTRFGLYRWHITDPVRFTKQIRVTLQDLGFHGDGRFLPRQDDMASTAFWYQTEPHAPFPKLPATDLLDNY